MHQQGTPGQCRFRTGHVEGAVSTEAMVVAPPALALKPHNSVLPHRSLAHPILLSLQTIRIPTDFHNQILWGLIFLALEPWCGAGTPGSHGATTAAKNFSRCLNTAHWCRAIPFHVSAPPTSHSVTFPL